MDLTAKRYGRTPSQIIGLVDDLGNPDRYFGFMVDMALAVKFDMQDKDERDTLLWTLTSHIDALGKAFKIRYPSSTRKPPVPRAEQARKEILKVMGKKVGTPTQVPTQEELFKRWNIKS